MSENRQRLLVAFAALALAAWAWSLTWEYGAASSRMRTNRWTGEVQVLRSDGWKRLGSP